MIPLETTRLYGDRAERRRNGDRPSRKPLMSPDAVLDRDSRPPRSEASTAETTGLHTLVSAAYRTFMRTIGIVNNLMLSASRAVPWPNFTPHLIYVNALDGRRSSSTTPHRGVCRPGGSDPADESAPSSPPSDGCAIKITTICSLFSS